jgi:hypothetical protein
MAQKLPTTEGPQLGPFKFRKKSDMENIEFVSMLGPDQYTEDLDHIPHSRVFRIKIGHKNYILKVVSLSANDAQN